MLGCARKKSACVSYKHAYIYGIYGHRVSRGCCKQEPISIIKPGKFLKNRIVDFAINEQTALNDRQQAQLSDAFSVAAIGDPSNFHKQYSDLVATDLRRVRTAFANEKLKIFRFDKFLTMRIRSICHSCQDGVILSTAKKSEFVY